MSALGGKRTFRRLASVGRLEDRAVGVAVEADWVRVEAEIAAIIAERPTEYGPGTRQNLAELLELLRATSRPAPSITPGYWPSFCVTWDAKGTENLEIEVFDDRYEVYRFFDGRTDIWYEHHAPGATMSSAFLSELPPPS
jgi:hypothetical protein